METKRGMHAYPDYPRFIKLEPVHGCNRHCDFCTLRNNKERLGFMSTEVWSAIVNNIDPEKTKKISFALHGEPTLHPKIEEMIRDVRRVLHDAKIMMITNGDVYTKGKKSFNDLLALFDVGLDDVQIDLYDKESSESFHRMKNELTGVDVLNYYDSGKTMWSSSGSNKRVFYVEEDSRLGNGECETRMFDTQGTSVPFEVWKKYGADLSSFPILRTCKELNKYLAINWDGSTKICCSDGSRANSLGNVLEESIEDIWKGKKADMVRYALHKGRRDAIPACYACSRMSFRDGLWPHWGSEYEIAHIAEIFAKGADVSKQYGKNMRELNSEHPVANRFLRERL